MTAVPVSVLGLQDAGEILTLQRAAYIEQAVAHNDFRLPPLVQTLDELRVELADPDVVALGIRENGRLLGAVRLHRLGTDAEVGRLMVVPDRQGEGLGTRLLRETETVFPHARSLRLFTGEYSTANIRLYIRLGYRETERTSAGDYQLVHFVKTLQQ